MTRSWDSAVVRRRSIASVAICTAVWKPNVSSVPPRSLSIVFGTPTTGTPDSPSRAATPSVSSPPIAISASTPCAASVARICSLPSAPSANGLVRDVPRIVPPRARIPAVTARVSSNESPSITPAQPWRKPTALVSGIIQAPANDRPGSRRSGPGQSPAAGQDANTCHLGCSIRDSRAKAARARDRANCAICSGRPVVTGDLRHQRRSVAAAVRRWGGDDQPSARNCEARPAQS
jgi:hypothetical protein